MPDGGEDRLEALIVAADDAGWAALTRSLKEHGIALSHSFPPRCAIGALFRSELDAVRSLSGVRIIVDRLPESELAAFPTPLRAAAAAWNEHLRSRATGRSPRGRGKSWDAPGLLPPDPPPAIRESLRRREAEAAGEPPGRPSREARDPGCDPGRAE